MNFRPASRPGSARFRSFRRARVFAADASARQNASKLAFALAYSYLCSPGNTVLNYEIFCPDNDLRRDARSGGADAASHRGAAIPLRSGIVSCPTAAEGCRSDGRGVEIPRAARGVDRSGRGGGSLLLRCRSPGPTGAWGCTCLRCPASTKFTSAARSRDTTPTRALRPTSTSRRRCARDATRSRSGPCPTPRSRAGEPRPGGVCRAGRGLCLQPSHDVRARRRGAYVENGGRGESRGGRRGAHRRAQSQDFAHPLRAPVARRCDDAREGTAT